MNKIVDGSGQAAIPFPSMVALQAVRKASMRASRSVHEELSEGMSVLATIAMVAPWVGMFGTVFGIVDSFGGVEGEKSAIMAALTERLSWSIWPTGVGLLVGLMALAFHRYLAGRLETIDREMDRASLELVNELSRCRGRFAPAPPNDNRMFGETTSIELKSDQKSHRWSTVLTVASLVAAWSAHVARNYSDYSLQLHSLALNAAIYVLFTFGFSCFVAYPAWAKLLRRRPGFLAVLGSALCLCWNVAEFVWGRSFP